MVGLELGIHLRWVVECVLLAAGVHCASFWALLLNHRIVCLEGKFKCYLAQTPLQWPGTFSHRSGAQICVCPAFGCFQERASITSLGDLFQCLTALLVKVFFLVFNINWPSFSLKPLPWALLKVFSLSSLLFLWVLKAAIKLPKGVYQVSQHENPYCFPHPYRISPTSLSLSHFIRGWQYMVHDSCDTSFGYYNAGNEAMA